MLRLILVLAFASVALSVPAEKTGRIVGGQDALLGQFPYQASLRRKDTGVHFCGAFIVTFVNFLPV
jgi:secreted trypsin-like serine protease